MPHSESQNNGRRRRTVSREALKQSLSIPLFRSESSNSSTDFSRHNTAYHMHSMLEPAVDGPPSPERLRQLSRQMKLATQLNRDTASYNNSPSSISPAPRSAAEHPPWEQAFADMSLSRRPSTRSISSSIPSRDRSDYGQSFGKDLLRRTKIKRVSSSHSSSNSSMHSTEIPGDGPLGMDSLIPNLFTRRKSSRDDPFAEKKLQISGPFNFKHVAHTQRRPDGRGEVIDEIARQTTSGPATAPGTLRIDAQYLPYPGYVSKEYDEYSDVPFTAPPVRPRLQHHHTSPASAFRRNIKQAKSQDQLRSLLPFDGDVHMPTRGTMSSSQSSSLAFVPPSRVSSRPSSSLKGFSAMADASIHQSHTYAIHQLSSPNTAEMTTAPQPDFPEYTPPAASDTVARDEGHLSRLVTTHQEDWPLATPGPSPPPTPLDQGLPDVPEEEDGQRQQQQQQQHQRPPSRQHKSKASLASNSSLRGSQSVPALRRWSQSNRRMSGASDTLGLFSMAAAHRATRADQIDDTNVDPLSTLGNWEDDIDYCYEHEADANFDYNWERSSLDLQRDEMACPVKVILEEDGLAETRLSSPRESSGMSISKARDGVSPNDNLSVTNFSFPRGDKGGRASHLRPLRPVSYASTFKESHGFHLSPSLLIPIDYSEMMIGEHNQDESQEYFLRETYQGLYHAEDSPYAIQQAPLPFAQRSSTSTTASATSSQYDSTGDRHVSTNSNSTTSTGFTVSSASSTSLNLMSGTTVEAKEPIAITTFIDINDDSDSEVEEIGGEDTTPPASTNTVTQLTSSPVVPASKQLFHKLHASVSLLRDEAAPLRSQDAEVPRRPRAKTSVSLSNQTQPVSQYAIFPRSLADDSSVDS